MVFGIGFSTSPAKERTSEDYFLARRKIGWFAIGASLFRLQYFHGTLSSASRVRARHQTLAAGNFRMAGFLHPVGARLTVFVARFYYCAPQRFHHARISGAADSTAISAICNLGVDLHHRLHFHENFGALIRCGDRAGARAFGWNQWTATIISGDRHRDLHDCRRPRGDSSIPGPGADSDFARRRSLGTFIGLGKVGGFAHLRENGASKLLPHGQADLSIPTSRGPEFSFAVLTDSWHFGTGVPTRSSSSGNLFARDEGHAKAGITSSRFPEDLPVFLLVVPVIIAFALYPLSSLPS